MLGGVEASLLAFKLAMLGFYLGILVYVIPIPLGSIKRWAPALLEDSLWAALVALSISALLALAYHVQSIIGGSWPSLEAWLIDAVAFAAVLKVLSSLASSLPEPLAVLKPVASTVASIMDELSWTITVLVAVVAGIWYLLGYSQVLLGIGAVLYALPFRIARPAGAWLIAFVIVFNAGLPALPTFVDGIADPPSVSDDGFWSGRLEVYTGSGDPMPLALVKVVYGGEEVASYRVENGVAFSSILGIPRVQLPLGYVELVVEYMGVSFRPEPPSVDTRLVGSISVALVNVAHVEGKHLMVYSTGRSFEKSYEDGRANIRWSELHEGDYAEVAWLDGCEPRVSIVSGGVLERGSWSWKGLEGGYVRVGPKKGVIELSIESVGCRADPSIRGGGDYVEAIVSMLDYFTFDLAKLVVVYYVTLPAMYISMLLAATAGLARVLGGGSRLRLKIL